jgi:hypothetical protein
MSKKKQDKPFTSTEFESLLDNVLYVKGYLPDTI